ncbi:MAG: translation elongation factor Ts [Candidatus Halichondribacter symbioticus]
MAITAAQVKELRDTSGAGMMDAKKALTETNGDMEAAVDWLRTKGLATAAKKSGRTTSEGLVGVHINAPHAVVVEVNAETDFVAKNADFQGLVTGIVKAAVDVDDLAQLMDAPLNGGSVTDAVTSAIATIGENMSVRRMARVSGERLGAYIHTAAAEGLGRIGVIVAINGGNDGFAKQVAMHIAATNPQSLDESDLDADVIAREKEVLSQQARESGKPEAVIEKMIVGRMKKFYADVTLVNQAFVINPDQSVGEAAAECGAEITGFVRFEVGDGIEKREENFMEEVAKTMKGGG